MLDDEDDEVDEDDKLIVPAPVVSPFGALDTQLAQDRMGRALETIQAGSLGVWNGLPSIARDWLIRNVFEPQMQQGKCDRNLQEAIYAADYEIVPPSPAEFLDSEEYIRHVGRELYPALRPHILAACDPTGGIYEVILTGASSIGKSFAACAILAYKLTRLFCLREPSSFYGLQAKSRIYFGLYAVSKKMVKQVGFEELKHVFIEPSPFFKDRFPPLPHGVEYIRWESKPVEIMVGCVAEGTLITTPVGDVPIEVLADASTKVLTFDAAGVRESAYEGVAFSGVKTVFDLELVNGYCVSATETHEFAAVRKTTPVIEGRVQAEMLPLGELREGDYVAVLQDVQRDARVGVLPAQQGAMQELRQVEQQRALPSDQSAETGPAASGDGPLYTLQDVEAARRFWPARWRSLAVMVPALRSGLHSGSKEGGPGEIPREGSAPLDRSGPACEGRRAVASLLCEESGVVDSARVYSLAQDHEASAARRLGLCGEASQHATAVQAGEPRASKRAIARGQPEESAARQVLEGQDQSNAATSPEHAYDGAARVDHLRTRDDVHLLLRAAGWDAVADRPLDSVRNDGAEYRHERGDGVCGLQQSQEGKALASVRAQELPDARIGDRRVRWARITRIQRRGSCRVYDVYNVPGTHLVFANGIGCSNSAKLHAIGRSLYACLGDELNYFEQGEGTSNKARELVAEVSRRLEARFVEEGGDIPGVAIYVSQTRTTSDYLENRVREKRGVQGVLTVRGPRWAFNPKGYHRDRNRGFRADLGDPYFRVFSGSEVADPRIVDRVTKQSDGTWLVEPIDADADGDLDENMTLKVPVLHYRAFMDDIHSALQAIADVPTGAFMPFFPRREAIHAALDDELPFPFSMQELPCYEKSELRLQEAYSHELVTRVDMGKLCPIRHPAASRFIAIDLAFGKKGGDSVGFAMVHAAEHRLESRRSDDDRADVGETEAVKTIEVDFYVALRGGQYGEPVDFKKIRIFIDWLRKIGFQIKLISCDSFQSEDNLQRLRDLGFNTTKTSTRRSSKPYRDLRQVFNEGRIRLPWPPALLRDLNREDRHAREQAAGRVLLFQELAGLEHDMKADKIDHRELNPDGSAGSNDVADALASAAHCCLTDELGPNTTIEPRSRPASVEKLNRYLGRLPF